ncbi:MAG: insulinase family protein, partial [Oligoflexales bacterium]|nr:insulinase family protein [Oligoflexales bacterium]
QEGNDYSWNNKISFDDETWAKLLIIYAQYGLHSPQVDLDHFDNPIFFYFDLPDFDLIAKKYSGEYWDYMNKHQGMANAYTASEDTNYMFQVNEAAFPEGLDRFAQFFVSPTFDASNLEKEKNAVHSEYDKNLKNDAWRGYQLLKAMVRPDHPANSFSIGNLDTLKKVSQKDVIDFYNRYYSANVMTLALYCKTDLEALEKMARTSFSDISNKNLKAPSFASEVFDTKALPQKILAKPIKDESTLNFIFPMPSDESYWRTKPLDVVSYLVGREGNGSLLSALKLQGLATELSSYGDSESYSSYFNISIKLTEQGRKNVDKVEELVFSYLAVMHKNGYPKHIYDLLSTMSQHAFVYQETNSPVSTAIRYAEGMKRHSGLEVDQNEMLYFDYSTKDFEHFVAFLKPDNSLIFYFDKENKTDKVEPYFSIDYAVKPIASTTLAKWKAVKAEEKLFAYPSTNQYLPTELALLSSDKITSPRKILDSDKGVFWFLQDTSFERPKAMMTVDLLTQKSSESIKSAAASVLMVRLLQEELNEWMDQLRDAGISLSFTRSNEGLRISLDGYSQHLPTVLNDFFIKLQSASFPPVLFSSSQAMLLQDLENKGFQDAFRSAIEAMNIIIVKKEIDTDLLKPELKLLTREKIIEFKKSFLSQIAFGGFAYGNLDAKVVLSTLDQAGLTLGAKFLAKKDHPKVEYVQLPQGKALAHVKTVKNNNNAWTSRVVIGKRTVNNEAIARMLDGLWSASYFNELRDKKQLGYVVNASASQGGSADVSSFNFILQSSSYNSADLAKHSTAWTKERLKELQTLNPEKFNEVRNAIIETLSKPDATMAEKHQRLWNEIISLNGDFNYRQNLIAQLKALDTKKFISSVNKIFDPKYKAQFSVYAVADKAKIPAKAAGEIEVKDLLSKKQTLPIF